MSKLGNWRPTSELPKKSGCVLIAGYHRVFGRRTPVVSIGHARVYGSATGPVFMDPFCDQTIVTHWMPLPKARSGWVSVKNKKPNHDEFLVYDESLARVFYGRNSWLYYSFEGELRMPGRHGQGIAVTHWMPLPEHPGVKP